MLISSGGILGVLVNFAEIAISTFIGIFLFFAHVLAEVDLCIKEYVGCIKEYIGFMVELRTLAKEYIPGNGERYTFRSIDSFCANCSKIPLQTREYLPSLCECEQYEITSKGVYWIYG